jgi:hypothetical protein
MHKWCVLDGKLHAGAKLAGVRCSTACSLLTSTQDVVVLLFITNSALRVLHYSCNSPVLLPFTLHALVLQASMASEGVRAWSGLLAELQAVSGAAPAAAAAQAPATAI